MNRLNNNIIAYSVNRAVGRGLYISVENGQVLVRAPWYMSAQRIQEYVEEKAKWISQKIREYENKKIAKRQYISNKKIKVFGEDFKMQITYSNTKLPKLEVIEGLVKVEIPSKYKKMDNGDIIDLLVENMYTRIANQEIEFFMEKSRKIFGIAPEDYEIVRIENTFAKCLDKNKIIINPDIITLKKELIEYIIMHQFCHLKYQKHVKGFYKLLELYMPKYKMYEKELSKTLLKY